MLGDSERLQVFRAAIERKLRPDDRVVEIGTGTGILAWYAAQVTSGEVLGIDIDEAACEIAREILAASPGRTPRIECALSVDFEPSFAPDVLITETLGPIGLEENIVELTAEFRGRHPSLRAIIPADVSVWLQPVTSATLRRHSIALLDRYAVAAEYGPNYASVRARLHSTLCGTMLPIPLKDCAPAGSAICAANFVLGTDATSRFETCVDFPGDADFDGVQVYFESVVGDALRLSSSAFAPATHWRPMFLERAATSRSLHISFDPGAKRFFTQWA
jgi:protein arginine N-methyltransferase 1